MVLDKRQCVVYDDGNGECFENDGGFWYSNKGILIKWIVLAVIFFVFFAWFFGGYIHAKQRLRKGLPLLSYHRFLVSYPDRKRYGQGGIPQNHFTFYQTQQPYQQRQDGAWTEPPPLYHNNDAPPQYFAPPGPPKANMNQGAGGNNMEMPIYGAPQGGQQSGVVGSSGDVEQGGMPGQTQQLPPRPQTAKTKIMGIVDRFRR